LNFQERQVDTGGFPNAGHIPAGIRLLLRETSHKWTI
jgi:hypothetical protein